jgi:hypothetical protein
MKTRFYIGLIVIAVLLLTLGRLVVRPPVVLGTRRTRRNRRLSRDFLPVFPRTELTAVASAADPLLGFPIALPRNRHGRRGQGLVK